MASQSQQMVEQAGAIPFRWRRGKLQFCLITSIRKGRWGFPKGMVDPGETHVETALKESYEEAGLHGEIVSEPLGCYEYAKWGMWLNVTMLLMQVAQTDKDWDESHVRERRWADEAEARRLLDRDELLDLLDIALQQIDELTDG